MDFQPYIAKNRRFLDLEFDFWITTPVAEQWYKDENQMQPERQWCAEHIKPGDTVIDCGSHHGMMTVIFSKLTGRDGRVVAFDPVHHNANTVRENLKLNDCINGEIREAGIGEQSQFIQVDGVTENVILAHTTASTSGSSNRIRIAALDDEFPPSVRVDFLKIDVEGFELEALRGARRLLQQRPILVLEIHNFVHGGQALAEIADILHPLDYEYYFHDEGHLAIEGPFPNFDEERVGRFSNPHVYCVPRLLTADYQRAPRMRPQQADAPGSVAKAAAPPAHSTAEAGIDWKHRYDDVVNSTSWRATAPIRRVIERIRGN